MLLPLILILHIAMAEFPAFRTYTLAQQLYPAWLPTGIFDPDLRGGDTLGSRSRWAGCSYRYSQHYLEEKVPSQCTSVRLLHWATAALHQVCQVPRALIAQALRLYTAGSFVVPINSRVGPKSDRARVSHFRTSAIPFFTALFSGRTSFQ